MRKMGWLVVAVVLALATNASALVDTAWVRTHTGSVSYLVSNATRLAVDHEGNVFVIGAVAGVSRTDFVLIKYDSAGTLLWERQYKGKYDDAPQSLALGKDNTVYVLGLTMNFNDADIVLLKFLSDGTLAWAQVYDGPGIPSDEIPEGVAIGRDGDIFVGGRSFTGTEQIGKVVLKYSSQGQLIWTHRSTLETDYEYPGAFCLDSNDFTYISSYGGKWPDMEPRILIQSVSDMGAARWSLELRDDPRLVTVPNGLSFDGFQHVYALGYGNGVPDSVGTIVFRITRDGTVDWAHRILRIYPVGPPVANPTFDLFAVGGKPPDADYGLVSFDTLGGLQWSRQFGAPTGSSEGRAAIAYDSFGNLYLTGTEMGPNGKQQIGTVAYSASGEWLWSYRVSGPSGRETGAAGLWVTDDGQPYVVGRSAGDIVVSRLRHVLAWKLDLLPGSCPNIISTDDPVELAYPGIRPGAAAAIPKKPTVPIAILGTKAFDVSRIDPATVLIEGLAPVSNRLMDVSRPIEPEYECECTTAGADGFVDLVLYFDRAQFIAALAPITDGEVRTLALSGKTKTGVPLSGSDCVTIKESPIRVSPVASAGERVETGFAAYPNPFNAATVVSFVLATDSDVRLDVYDVLGRHVATLVDERLPAGEHNVSWDAAGWASGVYFARLATSNGSMTRKMVLVR